MSTKLLVTYATYTGSTPGIAEAIADTLRENGAMVDVLAMRDVYDLTPYHAIIAGSPVHSSQWLPEALDFVRTHQAELQQKPFAAFLACMTLVMNNPNVDDHVKTFMQPVRDMVRPVSEGYFTGALHLDKITNQAARWGFRISVWMGVWKEGDHRDWDKIRAWTQSLVPVLMSEMERI